MWEKQKLVNIIKILKNGRCTLYAPALCPLCAPLPSLAPSALSLVASVRATAVGRGAERDAERNAVLAGDPKGLVYYVMID